MQVKLHLFAFLLTSITTTLGATFEPVRPPAVPLAVKSPYLNTILQAGSDGGNGGLLAGEWPTFWNGAITGWTGMIRVDGSNYVWMGAPNVSSPLVTQKSFKYTSTQSIFNLNVGGLVEMNVVFLSPVIPKDVKRSSLPFSYMNVHVKSMDGMQHDVQLYSDISAEWVSGARTNQTIQWKYGVDRAKGAQAPKGMAYHEMFRQNQALFSEVSDQTEYGSWYWTTSNVAGLSHSTGFSDTMTRSTFIEKGKLPNSVNKTYRYISSDFPVFGFANNLGTVSSSRKSVLYGIGLVQEYVIQFEDYNGNVSLPGLWTDYFDNNLDAVSFFYNDFAPSRSKSKQLDAMIESDSMSAGGQNYLTLTSLATRQAFATLQWANNVSDPLVFMKEISSDGNVNTADVIFPFHPITLYLNPDILKYLLEPLYINQEAGYFPPKYAIHDIGYHYPNATGHNRQDAFNAEKQPVEECGNMILMTLAYAQRANDNKFLSQHYTILKQWNNYLIKDSLIPRKQISTDDFAGPLANQTNLALKGIIGISAMAEIAQRIGQMDDAKNFTNISTTYIKKWQTLGIAQDANPPHTTLAYHKNKTHGLLYNLWADRALSLNLVPQSVYNMQSKFYPTVVLKYGVPLDTRHTYTKADWEIFAGSIASTSTFNLFTERISTWLDQTPTNFAFSDLYDCISGDFPVSPIFISRPVVGGEFAKLALNSAPGG